MSIVGRINNIITNITAVFFLILTVTVILQVFFRYVLNNPIAEFQELAIYCMVYLVLLGSTIAVYNKSHIAIDFFVEKVPPRLKKSILILINCIMIAFFIILLVQGYKQMLRSMLQISPTLGIPVGYVMFSIPLSAGISLIYILEQCKRLVFDKE